MEDSYTRIIQTYKEQIKSVEESDLEEFFNVENGINISRIFLQKLRNEVRQSGFKNLETEIHFFKELKPYVNGRLVFYLKLYQYLIERPAGSISKQRKFIDSWLERLLQKRRSYPDFERYYYQKDSKLDKYYFVRGKDSLELISDVSHYFLDPDFSTSHDILVAKILANELFINHLNLELDHLRKKELLLTIEEENPVLLENLSWTASKTDLVELIYALQAALAIRNGQADIKRMALVCEKLFD
ncbi:RteC domain-containing protein, partial [Psychroserpens sp.]